MRIKHLLLGAAMGLLTLASGQALALTGDEIMQRVDEQPTAETSRYDMEMILIDRKGNQRKRQIRTFTKDYGDVKKNALYFLSPADVRNTAFLIHDYDDANQDDDQWLFLPALKKTKRIAAGDKSGSFMGSDFSYADMSSRDLDDWHFKLLKETKVGEHPVWIIEALPVNQDVIDETGYVKSIVFVRQDNHVVIRALNQTEKGQQKLMDIKKLAQINGYWQPLEMHMSTREGKQIRHKTVMRISNVEMDLPLPDENLTLRQIEKGLR